MATRSIRFASVEEVLTNPGYFPVHIDLAGDRLLFVETSRSRLASMPFIDGRFRMTSGAAVEMALTDALAGWTKPPGPDRFIFHVAFCGSTLLATLLDVPGRSFGQREPRLLNIIADACGSQPASLVASALRLTRSLLRRPWRPGERTFCKPSNWANNLIPALTAHPQHIRPLFLAIDSRDHLLAMFRGGRERIAYVFDATRHLLGTSPCHQALWDDATVPRPQHWTSRRGSPSSPCTFSSACSATRCGAAVGLPPTSSRSGRSKRIRSTRACSPHGRSA